MFNKELVGAVVMFIICLYFLIHFYKRNKSIDKDKESVSVIGIRLSAYYLSIMFGAVCIIKFIGEIVKHLR